MAPPAKLQLPYGYKDAKNVLLFQAFLGEFFQGGLIFGWNALALMLKSEGMYTRNCSQLTQADDSSQCLAHPCPWQEKQLAVLWTIGVFALNFGPVFVGPVLDWVGPKLTAIIGTLLNMLSLVLIAFSDSHSSFNALPFAAVLMGLGGITFHLAQFHISNLFPRSRGLISSLFVSGFTGCGIMFYFLNLVYTSAGANRQTHQLCLLVYMAFIGLWLLLNFWMMPWRALQVGQVYLYVGRWTFKVMERKEVERQAVALRNTALDAGKPAQPGGVELSSLHSGDENGVNEVVDPHLALAYMGLNHRRIADSADPFWLDEHEHDAVAQPNPGASAASAPYVPSSPTPLQGSASAEVAGPPATTVALNGSAKPSFRAPAGPPDNGDIEGGSLPEEFGTLVFESRRFVELRKKPFWAQFFSAESTGMGVFYTMNVFCIQFYLGTTRVQLEHKGDTCHTYTNIANIIPAFGFLGIPVIGWMLDSKGYGITLGTINFLGVVASLFQAMPSLRFQVVTLIVWCAGRFFLYTSYFAIFGALFGFTNFGRMVAIDNTVNGLVGLLQLPLATWGLDGLGGNFTLINILQAVVLLPLFGFCVAMYDWERQDLVPLRPHEGDELPCNLAGPRQLREAKFLATLEKRISGAGGGAGNAAPGVSS